MESVGERGVPVLEVCVDNFASGIAAEAGGARRIELCSSLLEGGLTPSVGFLKKMKSTLKIPIFVMIRPRGGDFLYSEHEIQIMEEDIRNLKRNGADGFVFGILTKEGKVDEKNCERLLILASPLPSTFHRAFDLTPDPFQALGQVMKLGFKRILTSGQMKTAEEGIELINSLVVMADEKVIIMAGSGISPTNTSRILAAGVKEIHGSCRTRIKNSDSEKGATPPSPVRMGSIEGEMDIYVTSEPLVRAIVNHVNQS